MQCSWTFWSINFPVKHFQVPAAIAFLLGSDEPSHRFLSGGRWGFVVRGSEERGFWILASSSSIWFSDFLTCFRNLELSSPFLVVSCFFFPSLLSSPTAFSLQPIPEQGCSPVSYPLRKKHSTAGPGSLCCAVLYCILSYSILFYSILWI